MAKGILEELGSYGTEILFTFDTIVPSNHRDLYIDLARYTFKRSKVKPKFFKGLQIDIEYDSTIGDLGLVDWGDFEEHKQIGVSFNPEMFITPTDSAAETISHEFIHVKQIITGQWKPDFNDSHVWMGKPIASFTCREDYFEAPWEIEAYGRERGIAKIFVERYEHEVPEDFK